MFRNRRYRRLALLSTASILLVFMPVLAKQPPETKQYPAPKPQMAQGPCTVYRTGDDIYLPRTEPDFSSFSFADYDPKRKLLVTSSSHKLVFRDLKTGKSRETEWPDSVSWHANVISKDKKKIISVGSGPRAVFAAALKYDVEPVPSPNKHPHFVTKGPELKIQPNTTLNAQPAQPVSAASASPLPSVSPRYSDSPNQLNENCPLCLLSKSRGD